MFNLIYLSQLIIFWSISIGISAENVGLICFFNIDSVTFFG